MEICESKKNTNEHNKIQEKTDVTKINKRTESL